MKRNGMQLIEVPESDTKPRYIWISAAVSIVAIAVAVAVWQISFSLSLAIAATGIGNGIRLTLIGVGEFIYRARVGQAEVERARREVIWRLDRPPPRGYLPRGEEE